MTRSKKSVKVATKSCKDDYSTWADLLTEGSNGVQSMGVLGYQRWFQNLTCLEQGNLNLEGKYISEVFEYVKYSVLPCSGRADCKNQTEINSYFSGKSISFMFSDFYVDKTNSINPIEQYLNDKTYFVLSDSI